MRLVSTAIPKQHPPSRTQRVGKAVVRTCLCGCGAPITDRSSWAVGHASRALWAKLRAAGYTDTASFVAGRVSVDRAARL